ncbi:hypothetical protein J4E91_001110 [Alternaria rosae]|nr:hypothetical protein J4E91_001110 [Alternaria rosae]
MKLTAVVLALLSSAALAQEPTIARRAPAEMEKRAIVDATVIVDGLRYRTCPKTSCSAPGQYPKGTKIKLSCYTRDGTTTVNGDKGWAKVSGGVGNGRWVALAFGKYVDWSASISYC